MKRAALIVSGLIMLSSLCQLGRAGPDEEKVYRGGTIGSHYYCQR
jgi:hypothetical protein